MTVTVCGIKNSFNLTGYWFLEILEVGFTNGLNYMKFYPEFQFMEKQNHVKLCNL
jgi:hypothetical protein